MFINKLIYKNCFLFSDHSKRKIGFDQVFGFELTLLEPQDYWSKVPPKWLPYWHFYNTPISQDAAHAYSPVRMIKSIASQNDFVGFKLDIDTPSVEMPIAMSLLMDDTFASLVDEFFFELHFRCEVMTKCGWGKNPYKEDIQAGLVLDRPHVLKYFMELRHKGIRAHIWP